MSDKPKRGVLSISIRELLLVTMIVALVAGWWVHHRTMIREYLRLESENESLRNELEEERFPRIEAGNVPRSTVLPKDLTLEWILPTTH